MNNHQGTLLKVRDALEHGLDRTKKWCHYQGDSKEFHANEIAPIEQALSALDTLIAAVPDDMSYTFGNIPNLMDAAKLLHQATREQE